MKLSTHIFTAAVVSLPVSYQSLPGAAVLFLSAVIIDIDHYLFFSIHNKTYSFNMFRFMENYRQWSYYGPRIMIFHNYEFILTCFSLAWIYGGICWYVAMGGLFHLCCDQWDTWRNFRFARVRTLVGDITRYLRYKKAKKQCREKEYMIEMRNSWLSHLKNNLTEDQLNDSLRKCGVLKLYPEIPVSEPINSKYWQSML